MQVCNRCGGMLQTDTPRDVYDGGVYHVYCGWKLRKQHAEQEAVRNISADKGAPHADTVPEGGGGDTVFPNSELNVVLQVLRAMYRVTQYRFIGQAISDIEADMRPQVAAVNYHHICEHCFMEVDERDPNAFRMTARAIDGKESSKWIHYKCPELKPNRSV